MQEQVQKLEAWFSGYCRPFYSGAAEDQRNIRLKEEHTHRVCDNARRIAQGLAMGERDRRIAQLVALFHDVGRFPQYHQYRTFRDSASTNHAALGAKVLVENRVLEELPAREQDLIIRAVTLHNVFTVPEGLDAEALLHLRIIRDADKLDIWRVFQKYFETDAADRPNAVALELPDAPGYSAPILANLAERRMAHLSQLRSLNDFKLLQLAWIYDLNFLPSLRMVEERRVIDRISGALPGTGDIRRAVDAVRSYVAERLSAQPSAGADSPPA
jgi:hypothetical protein